MVQDEWLFPWRYYNVQDFLQRIASPRLQDMPKLADWIACAARQYDLRAEWLLLTAQKEQSALTASELSQHGRDWLMGFGYAEGRVFEQFRGAHNQVFAAAWGLRRYLTPGDTLYVGNRVGREVSLDGIAGTIRNLAEAAALQYTPHWSTLVTIERIWSRWFKENIMARPLAVVAREAPTAPWMAASYSLDTKGRRHPLLQSPGYCAAYAAECLAHAFEPEAGPNHRHVQTIFRYAGLVHDADDWARYLADGGDADLGAWLRNPDRDDLRAGDMVFWREGVRGYRGAPGHVAIVVAAGEELLVSENSSSRGIGVHPLPMAAARQIAGLKRWALPAADPAADEVLIIVGLGAEPEQVIRCRARLEEHDGRDVLRADVRPLLEALGWQVHAQHITTQGKVYIARC